MSAFICSNEHIDTITSWATANCTDRLSWSPPTVAALLFAENVRSVNFRYKVRHRVGGYTFRRRMTSHIPPVAILKLLDCYEYQVREHKGWARSRAREIVQYIRGAAIRELPGYSDAPWSI